MTEEEQNELGLLRELRVPDGLTEQHRERQVQAMSRRLNGTSASRSLPAKQRSLPAKHGGRPLIAGFSIAAAFLLAWGLSSFGDGGEQQQAKAPENRTAEPQHRVAKAGAGSGEVLLRRKAEEVPMAPGDALHAGDRVSVGPRGNSRFQTPSAAQATLGENSALVFAEISEKREVVQLARGRIDWSVPHLAPGATLAVRTPDAQVTVVGTAFQVEANERGTCVRVTEGRVRVDRAGAVVFVSAGEQWGSHSSVCSPVTGGSRPEAKEERQTGTVQVKEEREARGEKGPAKNETAPSASPSSTLEGENEMLTAAIQARRVGQLSRARALLAGLKRRYPDSPLKGIVDRELSEIEREFSKSQKSHD